MNFRYGIGILILALAMLIGCGQKFTEEQLRAKAIDFENKEQWEEAAKAYDQVLKSYPKSEKADEVLYRLGVLYANNIKDFQKSVDSYKKLIQQYPKSSFVIQSTFMIGYRYANDLKNLDEARKAYQEFLEKYPNHELASSVRWELDHLGQDISEIDLKLGASSGADSASAKVARK
jgi:tetratricopeptide (TPR) repeat protein